MHVYICEYLRCTGGTAFHTFSESRLDLEENRVLNIIDTIHETLFESGTGFQVFARRCLLRHIYANTGEGGFEKFYTNETDVGCFHADFVFAYFAFASRSRSVYKNRNLHLYLD